MVTTVVCRRVILEDQATMLRHREAWAGLCGSMRLRPEHLTVCLHPASKSLFAYLDTIAEHGQRKMTLKLHRAS